MPPTEAGIPSERELQLLALTIVERTGREIAQEFERTARRKISYGTLYTTLRRLGDSGWVEARDDQDEDGRLRFFKITGAGTKALNAGREHYRWVADFGEAKGARR